MLFVERASERAGRLQRDICVTAAGADPFSSVLVIAPHSMCHSRRGRSSPSCCGDHASPFTSPILCFLHALCSLRPQHCSFLRHYLRPISISNSMRFPAPLLPSILFAQSSESCLKVCNYIPSWCRSCRRPAARWLLCMKPPKSPILIMSDSTYEVTIP